MKKIRILVLSTVIFSLLLLASCGAGGGGNTEGSVYINLSSSNLSFEEIGATKTLFATVKGEVPEDKELTWESTDDKIATCVDGVVTAVGFGTCIIKAKIQGCAVASCAITVSDPIAAVILSSDYFEFLEVGKSSEVAAKNAWGQNIDDTLIWKTSNRKVAYYDDGKIVANGYGLCVLEAKSKNGAVASCVVRVLSPDEPRVTLSQNRIEFSEAGEEQLIGALTMPSLSLPVTWITTDASVATVYNGIVTSVGQGTCAIIATVPGGISAACSVSVGEKESAIPKDLLDYEVENLYLPIYTVDKKTSRVVAAYLPIAYRTEHLFDDEDTLVVRTYIEFVKIYDADGANGKNMVSASANLYRENWEFCESYYAEFRNLSVGDSFTFDCEAFGAGYKDGEVRYFRMIISRVNKR